MIKEDDLRFGVAFTNRGYGNSYPSGHVQIDLPTSDSNIADINTSSSSIAIEGGIVPYEGSLIALKYHLGSSKTIQTIDSEDASLEDYGYTEFSIGTRFKILDWFYINSSYSNLRQATEGTYTSVDTAITYDSDGNVTDTTYTPTEKDVILSKETNTFRLGVSFETRTWDIDLTTAAYRTAYSPTGWLYRPSNTEIDEEDYIGYYSMLSFIYRY